MKHIKILTDALTQWSKLYRSFGDYSVTTLLKPPRMVQLERRHKQDVVREPEQQVSAFIGTGVHSLFEECLRLQSILDPRYEVERTVYDKIEDRLITGKFDILWDGKHLYDVKTCKVWKKVFDPNMIEWHQQLNIYAYLLKTRGCDISSINIIAVYMDWQRQRSFRDDSGYPPEPIVEYELKLWPHEVTDAFVRERINLMKNTEDIEDNALPPCTNDEMWSRDSDTSYAVMAAPASPRALKVCASIQEAREYASQSKSVKPGISFIEIRRPERKRCESWCDGKNFCNQYAEYASRKQGGELREKVIL